MDTKIEMMMLEAFAFPNLTHFHLRKALSKIADSPIERLFLFLNKFTRVVNETNPSKV